MPVASTRSWSPSLSMSAKSDCEVSSRTPSAGALGHVLERAVAARAEQPVGQPRGLRDVEVLEAVAVGVADRDAVVSVRVPRQHRVEAGHPRVERVLNCRRNASLPADDPAGDLR